MAHIVLIVLPDLVNHSLLLSTCDVHIVVRIEYSNLLVPVDHSHHPIPTVPARLIIQLLVQLPSAHPWHHRFVAQNARDGQIILMRREHIGDLLLVKHLIGLALLLDFRGLFDLPALEVLSFILSD